MYIRFLAVLALSVAVAACEAESTTPAATADAATDTDAVGGSDTAKADTAVADTVGGDTAGTDAAGADTVGTDTAGADAAVAGPFAPAGAALAAKCASCHTAMPQAKFDGKDCATAAALAKKMEAQIGGAKMPPKGSPGLTADETAAITAWFAAGAKCN